MVPGLRLSMSMPVLIKRDLMRQYFMIALVECKWIGCIIFVDLKDLALTYRECQQHRFMISMQGCPVILQNHDELA
jgi:hypothetical protein